MHPKGSTVLTGIWNQDLWGDDPINRILHSEKSDHAPLFRSSLLTIYTQCGIGGCEDFCRVDEFQPGQPDVRSFRLIKLNLFSFVLVIYGFSFVTFIAENWTNCRNGN